MLFLLARLLVYLHAQHIARLGLQWFFQQQGERLWLHAVGYIPALVSVGGILRLEPSHRVQLKRTGRRGGIHRTKLQLRPFLRLKFLGRLPQVALELGPHRLLVSVQQHRFKRTQVISTGGGNRQPDPFNALGTSKVDFQKLAGLFAAGDQGRPLPAAFAIYCTGCHSLPVDLACGCAGGQRNVFAACEDLQLRNLQRPRRAGELHPHKPGVLSGQSPRDQCGAHRIQHKRPVRPVARATPRQLGVRDCFEFERVHRPIAQRQVQRVLVAPFVSRRHQHGAILPYRGRRGTHRAHLLRNGARPLHRTRKRGVPPLETLLPVGLGRLKPLLQAGQLLFELLLCIGFLRQVKRVQRRLVVPVGVLGLVKKRVETEILVVCNGVKLVRVTLCTRHRSAHPHRPGRIDPVDNGGVPELFVGSAPLVVGHRVPVKRRCDDLFLRGVRQQIPSELLDGKLVKPLVLVEGADGIISESPDTAPRITWITCRICIPGQIHPEPRPVLPKSGFRQQPVHKTNVGVWGTVALEPLQLRQCRGKPRQIQRRPPRQRCAVRLGRNLEPLGYKAAVKKAVHRVFIPSRVRGVWHLGTHRLHVSPVPSKGRPFLNPALQQRRLLRCDLFARFGRRHHLIPVARVDPRQNRTLLRLSRHHGKQAVNGGKSALGRVQPQSGVPAALALFVVRSMTMKAVIRKDRPDFAGEIHLGGAGCRRIARKGSPQKDGQQKR